MAAEVISLKATDPSSLSEEKQVEIMLQNFIEELLREQKGEAQ
jgi:hypothetical protein